MKYRAMFLVVVAGTLAGALTTLADDKRDEKALEAARAELKRNTNRLSTADHSEAPGAVEAAIGVVKDVREAENDDAVRFLLRYAREAVHDEVFRAIRAELGKLTHDDAVKELVAVLKAKSADWRERALAAQAAASIANPIVTEGVLAGLADNHIDIIGFSIAAAAKKEEKRVVDALVKLLVKLEDAVGGHFLLLRQSLVALTGHDFPDGAKWEDWWTSNREGFDFSRKGPEREAKQDPAEKVFLFGSELRSRRLVFVIDMSQSMKMEDPLEGPNDPAQVQKMQEEEPRRELSRFERTKKALASAIERLQPGQYFSIVAFASVCRTWQARPQPATEANRRSALQFVASLQEGAGTHTDEALERALDMNETDAIYLVSGGAPQKLLIKAGDQTEEHQRKWMAVCRDLVNKAARFRRLTVNTFGFCGLGVWHRSWGIRPLVFPLDPASVAPFREFMQELARSTGGEFKSL